MVLMFVSKGSSAWGAVGIEAFNTLYAQGDYQEALASLEQLPVAALDTDRRAYLRGKCYFALRDYPAALKHYHAISSNDLQFTDLAFQRGQSHYALMEMNEAKRWFILSLANRQKIAASHYYVAQIEHLNGNHTRAEQLFSDLAKTGNPSDEYTVLAALQFADSKRQRIPEQAPSAQASYVLDVVIPSYEAVLSIPNAGSAGKLAEERLIALKQEYTPQIARPWQLRLEQSMGWDSNVIAQTDESLLKISHTDSFYSKTEVSGRYGLKPRAKVSLTPRLFAQGLFYSDRRSPIVFENDQFLLIGGLYMGLAHVSPLGLKREGETFLDFEGSYLARDYRAEHDLSYFSHSRQVTLGEKTLIFPLGPTTFKGAYLDQTNYDKDFSSSTLSLGLAQEGRIARALVMLELGGERKSSTDARYDLHTFKALAGLIYPKLWKNIDYDLNVGAYFYDPIKQRETRGSEQLLTLLQTISYALPQRWLLNASLGIVDKNSRDKEHFAYQKKLLQAGVTYVF